MPERSIPLPMGTCRGLVWAQSGVHVATSQRAAELCHGATLAHARHQQRSKGVKDVVLVSSWSEDAPARMIAPPLTSETWRSATQCRTGTYMRDVVIAPNLTVMGTCSSSRVPRTYGRRRSHTGEHRTMQATVEPYRRATGEATKDMGGDIECLMWEGANVGRAFVVALSLKDSMPVVFVFGTGRVIST